jgi:integrase
VTYGLRYRADGVQRWLPLGLHGQITPDTARTLAKKRAGEVADGRDPMAERARQAAAATNSVDHVLGQFLKRHVHDAERPLRSAAQIESAFDRLVRPAIGRMVIYDVRRRHIVEMLDAIADANGPIMADRTLSFLSKAFAWWAIRDDEFASPIVRGMGRTKPRERARSRVLDDREIRDLWAALDQLGSDVPACYVPFVKVLLLTGQRRTEVSAMHVRELVGDSWIIPASRYKTKLDHLVPITPAVRALLPSTTAFVFSLDADGRRPFISYSYCKAQLDAKINALRKRDSRPPMPHFSYHDLRRTARSLLSRAGVSADHAERVIGHVIGGVRGVYDRFQYVDEKRDAHEKLAALIERILNRTDTLVQFPKSRRRQATSG